MKFLIDLNSSCFDRYLGFPRLGPGSAPVMNPPPPLVSGKAPSLPLMKAPLQTGVLSLPCPDHRSGENAVGTFGLLIKFDLLEGSGGLYPLFPTPQAHDPPKLQAWDAGRQATALSAGPGCPHTLGVPQPAVSDKLVCPNPASLGMGSAPHLDPPGWQAAFSTQGVPWV